MQYLILVQHLAHDYLLSHSERDVLLQSYRNGKAVLLKKENNLKYLAINF